MRLIRRLEANDSPSKNDGNGNDNDSGKGKAKASPPPPQKSQSPPPSRQSPPSSGAKKSPPSPSNGSGDGAVRQKSSELQPPPSGNDAHSLPSLPSSGATQHAKSANVAGIIAGVIVGAGVLIILFICILVAWCRKKKKKQQQPYVKANYATYGPDKNGGHHHGSKPSSQPGYGGGWATPPPPAQPTISTGGTTTTNPSAGSHQPLAPPPHPILALGINATRFTYDELAAATRGFSQANLLGQGGFGLVHKGVLPNGKEVAVKSLKAGSGQGEREFQAEVDIISRVHHRHLVSLVGYCIAGGQRMLVYEFLPNKTLEFHLHGKGQPVMDFAKRLKIALGSAKGLAYLHEDCNPRIIHRDIKGENILLDYAFEAKVADFGLAKLSDSNYSHVSTRVMGTFGYLAPEYASSGKLTDKSDVFSFGVMLLELITGRRPINPTRDEDNLVDWARPQFTRVLDEGVFEGFVDFRLENKFNPQEMTRMVACAAASIRHSAKRRPKMIQVVRALEGGMSLDALNGGVKPGESTYMGSSSSSEYDATTYHQDLQKFRKALESADFSSSSSGK